jgi:hypothetical protein
LGPRRHRAFLPSAAALVAASAAACAGVLGLDAPTLDPCASGSACADANEIPVPDAGSEAAPPLAEAGPLDAMPDAAPDAVADVIPDRGPSTGVRCGADASAIFCAPPAPECCLTLDDAGASSYGCVSGASACAGYPIACASNDDCSGTDVCCFYHSGLKCEPVNTASCANVLVCDPSGPSDQCNAGQTCSAPVVVDAGTLPYSYCK